MWAQSAGLGQGSTITVQLPLNSAASGLISQVPQLPIQRETTDLTGLRILVVDDEADILDLIQYILKNAGATVTIATSTPAAIAALIDDTLRQLSAIARKILQPEDRLQ